MNAAWAYILISVKNIIFRSPNVSPCVYWIVLYASFELRDKYRVQSNTVTKYRYMPETYTE
jgi:hypothetical protein